MVRVHIDKNKYFASVFLNNFGLKFIKTWTIDELFHMNSDQIINQSATRLSRVQVLIL